MGDHRLEDDFDPVLCAAQAGAGWAFEHLWHHYSGRVAGYLRLQGAADPEDLTNEVFLGVFRSIERFSGNEPAFRSWLFTIAHRRLLDARRSAGRRPAVDGLDLDGLDELSEPAELGPEPDVLRRLAEERVRALCDQLLTDQRDVLLLRLVAGFTVDEVAETIGKTPGAVKALQRRGLARLRDMLEREGVPL